MRAVVLSVSLSIFSVSAYSKDCDELLSAIQKIADVKQYLQCIEQRVPTGAIFAWDPIERSADGRPTGTTRKLPEGWQLCDGTNRTANLTGKFLRGAPSVSQAGVAGGSENMVSAGQHAHSGSTANAAGPDHGIPCSGNCGGYRTPTHAHSFTTGQSGDHTHGSILPPFYQVAYICKVE